MRTHWWTASIELPETFEVSLVAGTATGITGYEKVEQSTDKVTTTITDTTVDKKPEAVADLDTVVAQLNAITSGNVIKGVDSDNSVGSDLKQDNEGDGPASLVSVSFEGKLVSFDNSADIKQDQNGKEYLEIGGSNGTLKIYRDGDYDYQLTQFDQGNQSETVTIDVNNVTRSDLGFSVTARNFDENGNLKDASTASVGVNDEKGANRPGFGANGIIRNGASVQEETSTSINDTNLSEQLIVSFDQQVSTASVSLSAFYKNSNETEELSVTAYKGGTEVKVLTVQSENVNGKQTFDISEIGEFDSLVFEALPLVSGSPNSSSSDFLVESITYTTVAENIDFSDLFTYTIRDQDGDTSSSTLKITPLSTPILVANVDKVYEEALPEGTNSSSDKEVTTGNILADDTLPAGARLTSINGQEAVDGKFTVSTATSVLIVDAVTGAYTYTLDKSASHPDADGNNELAEQFSYVVTDSQNVDHTSSLTVTIVDDVPEAVNQTIEIKATEMVTNMTVVVDVSGSMSNKDLELTEQAIESLVNSYDAMGTVNVNVIQFFGNGHYYSGWQGPEYNVKLDTNKSGTDIEQGLRAVVEKAYGGSQPEASQDLVYFFGDGNTYGDYKKDFDDYLPEWEKFIDSSNVDKLFTFGVNTSGLSDLTKLSYPEESAKSENPVYIKEIKDLTEIVKGTIEYRAEGNLFADKGVQYIDFGADGGHLTSISIGDKTVQYDADNPVKSIETTHGTFTVNFITGDFSYTGSGAEDYSETIVISGIDGDGDPVSSNLQLNVDLSEPPTNTAPETEDSQISTVEDVTHTFKLADFPFSDVDSGNALTHVTITSLPVNGVLKLNGEVIAQLPQGGLVVTSEQINANALTFTPDLHEPVASESGAHYANFTFTVSDGETSSAAKTLSINVDAVADKPILTVALGEVTAVMEHGGKRCGVLQ